MVVVVTLVFTFFVSADPAAERADVAFGALDTDEDADELLQVLTELLDEQQQKKTKKRHDKQGDQAFCEKGGANQGRWLAASRVVHNSCSSSFSQSGRT